MKHKNLILLASLSFCPLTPHILHAQSTSPTTEQTATGQNELAARRLLQTAEDLFTSKESERAVKVVESVLERYPKTQSETLARLMLGRHYLATNKHATALENLQYVQTLARPGIELSDTQKQWLQEAWYLTGKTHYESGQYNSAFPILRRLTREYPNSVWANQAFYYIGMCHFAQGNWQKAIDALNLVGTFVDPDSPSSSSLEAGRRFYFKIKDADLPISMKLGKPVRVRLKTQQGDSEETDCIPLNADGKIYIGSIPTKVSTPTPANLTLEVLSGETVTIEYADENTIDGTRNIPRIATVKVVSSGTLTFTQGTFDSPASNAFLSQPIFLLLEDADLDSSPNPDSTTLTIQARHKPPPDENNPLPPNEEPAWATRQEITVTLKETAGRSGKFTTTILLASPSTPSTNTKDTPTLQAQVGDLILATYQDLKHIQGETPQIRTATLPVAGDLENKPRATQFVVSDPIIRARKNIVEATAFLELSRIFQSMGLKDGSTKRAQAGIDLLIPIIQDTTNVPDTLREQAFQLKWELEISSENYPAALATCATFSKLFPDSPLVDQALLGIANTRLNEGQYKEAIQVFNQILNLPNSLSKGEAQFRIAEATEKLNPENPNAAIPLYRITAERYPESPFTGQALSKLIDYHIEGKDYIQAEDLLQRIFSDHPDAPFLDAMLMKWVILAYRKGDNESAREKCTRLLFDYPNSSFATNARSILKRLEANSPGSPSEETAP